MADCLSVRVCVLISVVAVLGGIGDLGARRGGMGRFGVGGGWLLFLWLGMPLLEIGFDLYHVGFICEEG